MRRNTKKNLKWMLLMVLLTAVVLLPGTAMAEDTPLIPSETTMYKMTPALSQNWVMRGVKSEKGITKLKSSNPKVAAVSVFENNGTVFVGITALKTGKTVISFTAKVNGKKKRYKSAVTVKKYRLPFSVLKLGSVDLTKKLAKTIFTEITLSKSLKKQKFTYKLKKGWSIEGMGYYNSTDGGDNIVLENGKKITLKAGRQMQINLRYKDGSQMCFLIRFRK